MNKRTILVIKICDCLLVITKINKLILNENVYKIFVIDKITDYTVHRIKSTKIKYLLTLEWVVLLYNISPDNTFGILKIFSSLIFECENRNVLSGLIL